MRPPNDRVVRLTLTLVGFFGTLSFAQTVWATKCWNDEFTNSADLLRLSVTLDGEHVPEEDPLSLSWSTVGYLNYYEQPADEDTPAKVHFKVRDVPSDGDSFTVPVDVTP